MMKKKLIIEGMSCGHCAAHVEEALKEVDGIISVLVKLKEKNALIELTHDIDDEKLREVIGEAGYELVGIE